ncbi:hypothetical protein QQ045_017869 [Rhodiola kirilowii]
MLWLEASRRVAGVCFGTAVHLDVGFDDRFPDGGLELWWTAGGLSLLIGLLLGGWLVGDGVDSGSAGGAWLAWLPFVMGGEVRRRAATKEEGCFPGRAGASPAVWVLCCRF